MSDRKNRAYNKFQTEEKNEKKDKRKFRATHSEHELELINQLQALEEYRDNW